MGLQSIEDLDNFYKNNQIWQCENMPDEKKRKDIILSEIPYKNYKNVLDIGCGNGFITKNLPGENILGIDISSYAITQASQHQNQRLQFLQSSLFNLPNKLLSQYDLVVISDVLYPHYIGKSYNSIYLLIDNLLADEGILLCCHIHEWYEARFPYFLIEENFFDYQNYTQRLEVYIK